MTTAPMYLFILSPLFLSLSIIFEFNGKSMVKKLHDLGKRVHRKYCHSYLAVADAHKNDYKIICAVFSISITFSILAISAMFPWLMFGRKFDCVGKTTHTISIYRIMRKSDFADSIFLFVNHFSSSPFTFSFYAFSENIFSVRTLTDQ